MLNRATRVPPDAVFNCPNDDLSEIAIVFASPSSGMTAVLVDRTGCQFANSTGVVGGFLLAESTWTELDRLLAASLHAPKA